MNFILNERFTSTATTFVAALFELIAAVQVNSTERVEKPIEKLAFYESDRPRFNNLVTELQVWRGRWIGREDLLSSLVEALHKCSKDLFPNIHALLQIATLVPAVTSCEAERLFSAVQHNKAILRSSMEAITKNCNRES